MNRQVVIFPLLGILLFACVASAGVVGRVTASPARVAQFPSYSAVTTAGTTLVHNLESDYRLTLAQAPDFLGCSHAPVGRTNCVFRVTFFDESSSVYRVTLNHHNAPISAKRLRFIPPPAQT